jgi:hypothetical protein
VGEKYRFGPQESMEQRCFLHSFFLPWHPPVGEGVIPEIALGRYPPRLATKVHKF